MKVALPYNKAVTNIDLAIHIVKSDLWDWLVDNIGKGPFLFEGPQNQNEWDWIWDFDYDDVKKRFYAYFYFKDIKSALLFKLTWGGDDV